MERIKQSIITNIQNSSSKEEIIESLIKSLELVCKKKIT